MTQLGLAMHAYQSQHGRLPPAVVYGNQGEPLHSWRVLLLPYLEQEELYREFDLTQPWDSDHNLPLLARMPSAYAAPGRKAAKMPAYHTVCKVFVGKHAAFEGSTGLNLKTDFPDGTPNTILVAEWGPPVPWSKPEDNSFDADGPPPAVRGLFKEGARVCFADGSMHWIRHDISPALLRAAITRDGQDWMGSDLD